MTRAEILNCLTDRPCEVCRFHESGRCERWDCVFEEKPDEPEQKVGRWIKSDAVLVVGYTDTFLNLPAEECSVCHKPHIRGYGKQFCPNCGAKMAESEVSE